MNTKQRKLPTPLTPCELLDHGTFRASLRDDGYLQIVYDLHVPRSCYELIEETFTETGKLIGFLGESGSTSKHPMWRAQNQHAERLADEVLAVPETEDHPREPVFLAWYRLFDCDPRKVRDQLEALRIANKAFPRIPLDSARAVC